MSGGIWWCLENVWWCLCWCADVLMLFMLLMMMMMMLLIQWCCWCFWCADAADALLLLMLLMVLMVPFFLYFTLGFFGSPVIHSNANWCTIRAHLNRIAWSSRVSHRCTMYSLSSVVIYRGTSWLKTQILLQQGLIMTSDSEGLANFYGKFDQAHVTFQPLQCTVNQTIVPSRLKLLFQFHNMFTVHYWSKWRQYIYLL